MIGCQVSAPAIGLAARPSWAHARAMSPPHTPTPHKSSRCWRGQAESECQGSWVKIAQLTKREDRKNRWHSRQGSGLRTASESTRESSDGVRHSQPSGVTSLKPVLCLRNLSLQCILGPLLLEFHFNQGRAACPCFCTVYCELRMSFTFSSSSSF